MRKTVLFILSIPLVSGSMIQVAAATGHHFHKEHSYSSTLTNHGERNLDDFGFSGRDSSRPGGEDPNLNPSGS
jgi:hypothetical protein